MKSSPASAQASPASTRVRDPLNFTLQHFREVSSTNSLMREHALQGAAEGLVIVADYQTEGRGKPGRTWISPPGKNLLFSILLRPPMRANEAPILTQLACRAVANALKAYGLSPAFKRPNDLMINGKKICGVLVETISSSGGKLDSLVVGIGLNVNAGAGEIPEEATSLKILLRKETDKEILLGQILQEFKTILQGLYAPAS